VSKEGLAAFEFLVSFANLVLRVFSVAVSGGGVGACLVCFSQPSGWMVTLGKKTRGECNGGDCDISKMLLRLGGRPRGGLSCFRLLGDTDLLGDADLLLGDVGLLFGDTDMVLNVL
jgi:hypothetical protein